MFNLHTHVSQNKAIVNIDDVISFVSEPNYYYSLGNHPWRKDISVQTLEELLIKHPQIIAIGECGLDKQKSYHHFEEQIKVFEKQVILSEKHQKPIILHVVKSYSEMITLKKKLNPKQPWVVHGFNKYKQADVLLNNGFYLSFGASLLVNVKLQEVFKNAPLCQVFLETDESAVTIAEIYTFAAQLRQMSVAELSGQIQNNCKTVFKCNIG